VSFSEDCVRFGDQLAKLVDAGVSVQEAAARLGISRQRGYAILRATGRAVGSPRPDTSGVDTARVAAVFTETGSINQAAKAVGVSHATARRVLVEQGLVSQDRQPYGKAAARARFLELIEEGWSAARAAREVGVHLRTARDWRDGIRKIGNTRVRADGTVIAYGGSGRYTQSVNHSQSRSGAAETAVINTRYLSLSDRLVIADGLLNGLTLTAIAAHIDKHKSTVSREVRAHSVDGRPSRGGGSGSPEAVQTGHQPEAARCGGRRAVAAIVTRADLASPGQGFPGRREYAGGPRNDLPSAVLPGPRRTETRSPTSTSVRTYSSQTAPGPRSAYAAFRRPDDHDQ
jgi:transposase